MIPTNVAQVVLVAANTSKVDDKPAIYWPYLNLLVQKNSYGTEVIPQFYERGKLIAVLKEIQIPENICKELKSISEFKSPCITLSEDIIEFFSTSTQDA